MLETVVVQSSNPLTLNVTGADPSDLITVKSISGLTSPKVGLYVGDYSGEGSYYQGRRGVPMNPVMTLKMNPNYSDDISVSDIREMLYRAFFMPLPNEHGVKVLLIDDRKPDRYFVGYTETIESEHFSPLRDAQVSMRCMDAYLFSDDEVVVSGLYSGSISLPYDGSAPTGLEFTLAIVSATPTIAVALNEQTMLLYDDFQPGDVVTINTNQGKRSVLVNGVPSMHIWYVDSKWLQLERPNNQLTAAGWIVGDGKVSITSYKYRAAWWGI